MSPALEFLSPDEAAERWSAAPIAYVPMGPLEFHGRHLPVGLDPLVARGVCLRAAARTGGLVLPPLWHGTGGEHGGYPFSHLTTTAAMEPLLVSMVGVLRRWGAEAVVLFSGHMAAEQGSLLATVAADADQPACRVLARSARDWKTNPFAPDHAALFETTLLGALHPELVHVERLPKEPLPEEATPFGQQRHDPAHPLHGIFGPDPRGYDERAAPKLLDALVTWLAREVGEACSAAKR